MSILEVLAQKKIIRREDIAAILNDAEEAGVGVEQILLQRGVEPEEILKSKSEFLDIPVHPLKNKEIPAKILEYIPEESATHYRFLPLAVKEGVLEVGVVDPDNLEARDALNFIASKIGMPFKLYLISEQEFESALAGYKGLSGEVTKALSELETELGGKKEKEAEAGEETSPEEEETSVEASAIDTSKELKGGKEEVKIVEDAPVTKIVATILRYAIDGNASDIHIERMRENLRVRFRVDGVMNTSLVLPTKIHSAVVARIKILSNMRLDEKRKPQDGRFSAKIGDRRVDFRVSTFPAYFGEKVVMRILDQAKGVKTLEDLLLTDRNLALIRKAIKRPYGLILISGPTGSGKSTTLYSMLNEIDREHKNVLSLEDPVEYTIEGMSQSQIRPEIGYSFATGLRTTLRQDPDIIMVGEIRDKETAQLAIQAALTGHLVLSTIHTNDAIGVIPRLIDMEVDPYLIAPTLILTMAQRLARVLCPGAGKPLPVEGSIKMMIERQFADLPEKFKKEIKFGKEVYEISPTNDCPNGTRGRCAVMEMIEMDKDIEQIILRGGSELELKKTAREKGMLTMKEDAILKAFQRIIPFEEVGTL
ncbi:type II/IV secretion system protein [Patescibacteria group bacterium]|nr:MAG: type II/IV secretion system protein [Patescibacteria group bacterium]